MNENCNLQIQIVEQILSICCVIYFLKECFIFLFEGKAQTMISSALHALKIYFVDTGF